MRVYENILEINSRKEFREWLEQNHNREKECYIYARGGKPIDGEFNYIDAVEEALCFGWIDSTIRTINEKPMRRFSPRRSSSHWTELNKERVRRLEKLGLMTDAGRNVLPEMSIDKVIYDEEIINELKNAGVWENFQKLHPLYQRIKLTNLFYYKERHSGNYDLMLKKTIDNAREGKTCGQWNDYGRLLEY